MKEHPNLTQKEFDELLNWLSPNKDVAGRMYLDLKDGINRFFQAKGCHDTERLTDETIDRLAQRLTTLEISNADKPVSYAHGFAKNIYFEYLASQRRSPVQLEREDEVPSDPDGTSNEFDPRLDCLDDCVLGLPSNASELVLAYYEKDGGEKVRARRELAENLQISLTNLAVRVGRVRNILRECMENCLKSSGQL